MTMLSLKQILSVTPAGAGRVGILDCFYTCHYKGDNDYNRGF